MGVNPLEPQISAIRVKNLTFWNFIRFLRSTVYKMAAEVTVSLKLWVLLPRKVTFSLFQNTHQYDLFSKSKYAASQV